MRIVGNRPGVLFLCATLLWIPLAGCGDVFNNSDTSPSAVTPATDPPVTVAPIVTTKATLSGSVSGTLAKPSQKPVNGVGVLQSPMADGEVKVIDSTGKALGTAKIAADGTYTLEVDKGVNYVVRATKGNVALKSFVEKADANMTVAVDPTSSAIVKVLSKKIGNDKLGEVGADVSTQVTGADISAIIVAIKNSGLLKTVAQAIHDDIAANANYSSTTVTVGVVSAAGDGDANTIAITITITIVISGQQGAAAVPTGVTAVAGDGKVTVSWTAVTGATSYNLYYSAVAGVAGIKINGITGTSYTLTGLTNGVVYYFTVTASNSAGESAGSTPVKATFISSPAKVSAVPGWGQVSLTWSAVSGAASYNIYWSTATGVTSASGTKIAIASGTAYVHTGLVNGTAYYYIVRAVYGSDEGASSAEAAARPMYTKQIGAAGAATWGWAIAKDADNNIFVAGDTTGGLDGNTLAGVQDAFVIKYSAAGARLWTKQLGVAGATVSATAITTDASGNVYVGGNTNYGLDGNTYLSRTGKDYEYFITKYNAAGVKQWTVEKGGWAPFAMYSEIVRHNVNGMSLDASGNIVVAGLTSSVMGIMRWTEMQNAAGIFQSPNPQQYFYVGGVPAYPVVAWDSGGNFFASSYSIGPTNGFTLIGTVDAFVAKYNAAGVTLWTRQIGTTGLRTYSYGVATDAGDNLFAVGQIGHPSVDLTPPPTERWDLFVAKYNAAGVPIWIKQLGGGMQGYTAANGAATDANGNVFAVGLTTVGLDGNTVVGTGDLVVVKYNAAGVKQWTRLLGVSANGTAGLRAVCDSNGNVFVTGYTSGGLDGNLVIGNYTDAFLVKYNSAGEKQ